MFKYSYSTAFKAVYDKTTLGMENSVYMETSKICPPSVFWISLISILAKIINMLCEISVYKICWVMFDSCCFIYFLLYVCVVRASIIC